jgi:uncharacterized 2Fe-2S/4Fe-4S cluster protein (DUF4445 family)
MAESHTVHILPSGMILRAGAGQSLIDILYDQGVEFPCGGKGTCGGCRVRVKEGAASVTEHDLRLLTSDQIEAGWRLACCMEVTQDITLEIAGWGMGVLSDSSLKSRSGGEGYGIAIDLGTTTIAGQAIELSTGRVLASMSGLNVQARSGADIMSRVAFGLDPDGLNSLNSMIRRQIGAMVEAMQKEAGRALGSGTEKRMAGVVIVGNTVMHHLFGALPVESLSHYPFESPDMGEYSLSASELGWDLAGDPRVVFLACLGGFVGSDILAGVLASELLQGERPRALIDLGTNGEIVVAAGGRMLCASTAAGPAFEGARITCGMRAAAGAIDRVLLDHGCLTSHVIGGGEAVGICGSGLVDAAACGLAAGLIQPSGRISGADKMVRLSGEVFINQQDIRELQLAKAAISAGLNILLRRLDLEPGDLDELFIAGAFGNYIHLNSARAIGLIHPAIQHVSPIGNSALHGAKIALLADSIPDLRREMEKIEKECEHVSLNSDMEFMERFTEEMAFPEKSEPFEMD